MVQNKWLPRINNEGMGEEQRTEELPIITVHVAFCFTASLPYNPVILEDSLWWIFLKSVHLTNLVQLSSLSSITQWTTVSLKLFFSKPSSATQQEDS